MKIFIETYGCQMNVADSELVASILTKTNFNIAENIDEADIIIFNTCSVRQHAEDRVIGRINNEIARKVKNKNLKIGVIGCMAQRLGHKLKKQNSSIDFVVGTDQYRSYRKLFPTCLKIQNFIQKLMLITRKFIKIFILFTKVDSMLL